MRDNSFSFDIQRFALLEATPSAITVHVGNPVTVTLTGTPSRGGVLTTATANVDWFSISKTESESEQIITIYPTGSVSSGTRIVTVRVDELYWVHNTYLPSNTPSKFKWGGGNISI